MTEPRTHTIFGVKSTGTGSYLWELPFGAVLVGKTDTKGWVAYLRPKVRGKALSVGAITLSQGPDEDAVVRLADEAVRVMNSAFGPQPKPMGCKPCRGRGHKRHIMCRSCGGFG